jgi:hypothetical protein
MHVLSLLAVEVILQGAWVTRLALKSLYKAFMQSKIDFIPPHTVRVKVYPTFHTTIHQILNFTDTFSQMG